MSDKSYADDLASTSIRGPTTNVIFRNDGAMAAIITTLFNYSIEIGFGSRISHLEHLGMTYI